MGESQAIFFAIKVFGTNAQPALKMQIKGVWGTPQQAFCNAKQADVYTSALLATTIRPFCPQFVIFRLEKNAMAKTKAEEKALNLDQILFNCRDYLRAARNSGSFFEKRDIPRSTAPKFSKRSWNRQRTLRRTIKHFLVLMWDQIAVDLNTKRQIMKIWCLLVPKSSLAS